jgi:hypothetical protein
MGWRAVLSSAWLQQHWHTTHGALGSGRREYQTPTRRLVLLGLSSRRELAEARPCGVDALAPQELRLYRKNVLGALALSEPITIRLR